jgi:hypothetical protein
VVGDELEREVVAEESRLDQEHGEGQQGRDRVDRAARGVDPAAIAAARPVQGGRGRVEGEQQGEDQRRGAELRQVFFSSVNLEGHFVTRLSRSPTKVPSSSLPVTITSRPSRNGSGIVPV